MIEQQLVEVEVFGQRFVLRSEKSANDVRQIGLRCDRLLSTRANVRKESQGKRSAQPPSWTTLVGWKTHGSTGTSSINSLTFWSLPSVPSCVGPMTGWPWRRLVRPSRRGSS